MILGMMLVTVLKPKLPTPGRNMRVAETPGQARTRGSTLQAERKRIWLAHGCKCAGCGRVVLYPSGFELDHIIPLSLGGADADSNKQILCVYRDARGVKAGCHVDKTGTDGSR